MQLSPHFTLHEATYSEAAERNKIINQPTPEHLERIKFTAHKMEMVRQLLGNRPIKVTSWYRSAQLNKIIGGANSSQHTKGEAVDFKCLSFGNARDICKLLSKNKDVLQYDQLILEPTWAHISFVLDNPRGNDLTFITGGRYIPGIS